MQPLDMMLRLVIAAVCGAVVGLPVELRGRPGGLRTHTLATVGAATFCMAASSVMKDASDATRVIQGIASGVGFIGAAAVLRESGRVRGIATAASLWITAAIGCEAGLGYRGVALAVAGFVFVLDATIRFVERRFLDRRTHRPATDQTASARSH